MSSPLIKEAKDLILAEQLLTLAASGSSLRAAAKALGVTYGRAERLYHAQARAVYDANATLVQEVIGKELATLDLMQRKVMPLITGPEGPDLKAVDKMLAIMARRARYLDLDAATKVEVQVTAVDDALARITDILDGEIVSTKAIEYVGGGA